MTYKNINNAQAIKIVGLPEQNTIANLQQEIQKMVNIDLKLKSQNKTIELPSMKTYKLLH